MSPPGLAHIREVILTVVQEQGHAASQGSLQQGIVLDEVANRLRIRHTPEHEVAVLTLWNDLFRTGYLGWGMDLRNPNPPFLHVTDRGRKTLERLSRDPGNPAGYLQHVRSVARLSFITEAYLTEALECFTSGLYNAAAVMLGCAAESILLEMRQTTVRKLEKKNEPVPRALTEWKPKTVLDTINRRLSARAGDMHHTLREAFESYWPALTQQIRATRNDAGHPEGFGSVTEDGVHASFLLFPELARLANRLHDWIEAEL